MPSAGSQKLMVGKHITGQILSTLSIIQILEKNWMQVIKKHILIKSQAFDLVMDDEAGSFTNFISLLN